ncbi:MAG: TrkA family potassium uptake protein [Chloroflexi bacterium]|nr:MAG: TrkA family potassium uptake protein [Chloroflexota bacterium]
MRVLIIGCGRVGARTAMELDRRGENVTIIDSDQRAFLKLPAKFGGASVRGSGTDEAVLREAGAGMTDLLMALTEGDNRNALAAQIGKHLFGIPRVVAKINDPVRAEAYRSLGLETICRTVILSDALVLSAMEGAEATDGEVLPPTAEPIQGAPTPGSRAHAIARAAAREEEGVELENREPEAARVGTVRDPGQEA